jgi:methylase of polypeptide subunit release factors
VDAALPSTRAAGAEQLGLVAASGHQPDDEVRPLVDLRPYSSDDGSWWLASDVGELATVGPLPPDHVLGVGGASLTLARWVPRDPVLRALDVGTGCGVQAFHLAQHSAAVVASDTSARCLAYAAFNAALNAEAPGAFGGRSLDLRRGDLLEPVRGEKFDLVVSNPPFVISPRVPGFPMYEYRDGGRTGDQLVKTLVGGVADVLTPGGIASLLGCWEQHEGEDWADRVTAWLPPQLDAWVVQREVQDPAQYAETWARDGGHRPGQPSHSALVMAWLDDFAARGVEGVGFGIITLRLPDAGGHRPRLRRLEELSTPLAARPLGQAVSDLLAAHDWLSARSDDALLAERLVVAPDVTEERHGRPGDEHPLVLVLRQGGGLERTLRADTALAGLVGACDGELPLGRLLGALSTLLHEPVAELTQRLLPQVRALVGDGLLLPG